MIDFVPESTLSPQSGTINLAKDTVRVTELNQVPIHQASRTKDQGGLLLCVGDGRRGVRSRTSFLTENRSGSDGSGSAGTFLAYIPVYSKGLFDITGPSWVF
jgi:hypothetical protein